MPVYNFAGDVTPGLTRCGDHCDYGTITLLFQDAIGGLEVKDVGEGWIRAPPIEGTILVNRLRCFKKIISVIKIKLYNSFLVHF